MSVCLPRVNGPCITVDPYLVVADEPTVVAESHIPYSRPHPKVIGCLQVATVSTPGHTFDWVL